jgi:hypothetical protein
MIKAPLRHRLPEGGLLPLLQFLIFRIPQIHTFKHRTQELRVLRTLSIVAVIAMVIVGEVAAPKDLYHFAFGM